jgi:hypothetical protein
LWGRLEIIMMKKANLKRAHTAHGARIDFDYSNLLWCGIIGVALVIAVALTLTMSGPSELAAGAVPP